MRKPFVLNRQGQGLSFLRKSNRPSHSTRKRCSTWMNDLHKGWMKQSGIFCQCRRASTGSGGWYRLPWSRPLRCSFPLDIYCRKNVCTPLFVHLRGSATALCLLKAYGCTAILTRTLKPGSPKLSPIKAQWRGLDPNPIAQQEEFDGSYGSVLSWPT